jgi:hypothetical protein
MLYKLFAFFVIVALAAIGLIEWYKGLVNALKQPKGKRAQAITISLLSLFACLVAGDIAVIGGLFKGFGLIGPAAGAFVGCIALGFVELAYQLVVQVFLEAVKALIRWLRSLFYPVPAERQTKPEPDLSLPHIVEAGEDIKAPGVDGAVPEGTVIEAVSQEEAADVMKENQFLKKADPDYEERLKAAAAAPIEVTAAAATTGGTA